VVLNGRTLEANRRMALNQDWSTSAVNTSAVERRTATLVARRTVKKDNQRVAAEGHCVHGPDYAERR